MRVADWEKYISSIVLLENVLKEKKISKKIKLQNCSLSINTDQALLLVSGVTPILDWPVGYQRPSSVYISPNVKIQL